MAEARERLKHGKSLCGKVFRRFVETFNWLVDFSSNLRGDGEQGGSGQLVLDRTDEKHPVIRCKGCVKGEGGSSSSTSYPQCFDLESEKVEPSGGGDPVTVHKLVRCYYSMGDQMNYVDDIELDDELGYGILCFRIDVSPSGSSTPDWADTEYVSSFETIEELRQAQTNPSYVLVPLYKFEDEPPVGEEDETPPFKILADLRRAPRCNVFETLNDEEEES